MSAEPDIRRQTLKYMAEWAMTTPGDTVLCALSGGADSAAMTDLLWRSRQELGLRLAAAHFIHGLRPEDAPAEEELVRQFCRLREIPLAVGRGDTRAFCRQNRCGLEEGARRLRYEFLRKTAQETGAGLIATAHHMEDNGETILLNLCRGAGLRGLGGIPPKRDGVIRPILTLTRAQIEKYLAENGIPYSSDPSNQSEEFARNRLRKQVFPVLQSVNSQAAVHLCQAAQRARQDETYLEQAARELIEQHGGGRWILANALAQAPPSLALRAVQLLYAQGGGQGTLSDAHRRAVLALCDKGPSARLARPGGVEARRQYQQLIFGLTDQQQTEGAQTFAPQALEEGKPVWQNGWQVTLYRGPAPAGEQGQLFRFERLTPPVILRPRQPGDRVFQGGQNKSVKKWMIDQKIPAAQRDGLPLVCDGQGVALICGGIARDGQREGIPGWTLAVRRI